MRIQILKSVRLRVFGVLWAMLSTGCGECGAPRSQPDAGSGLLNVAIVAPGRIPGNVMVTGPNGFSTTLTQSAALAVPPGSYTVTATPVPGSPRAIPLEYGATVRGSPIEIADQSAVQVAVEYAEVPGSGNAWIAGADSFNGSPALLAFAPFAQDPMTLIDQPMACPGAMALDPQGAIWVTDYCHAQILKFSASQLGDSNARAPAVSIQNNYDGGAKDDGGFNLMLPICPAFDSDGNLWVTDATQDALVKYSQVESMIGMVVLEPTAVVLNNLDGGSIASDGGRNFRHPYGIAFDDAGNLWVSSANLDELAEYSNPSSLTGTVAPTPIVILNNVTDGGVAAFLTPMGLAFDSQNNLWVANLGGPSIAKLAAAQLASSAAIQPAGLLINDGGELLLFNPAYLAFDQTGDLLLTDNGRAMAFPQSLIGGLNGPQAFDAGWVVSYGGGNAIGGVLVDPTPDTLPLRGGP